MVGGTNLALWSQTFANAAWSKQNATILADVGTAPDGTMTAAKHVVNTASQNPAVWQSASLAVGDTYTISIFAKAAGYNWLALDFGGGASRAYFNLATGQVGSIASGVAATIEDAGGGWWRASITRAATSSDQYVEFGAHSADGQVAFAGDGSSGILVWGMQLNRGGEAQAYVPTTSTAVTVATAGVTAG